MNGPEKESRPTYDRTTDRRRNNATMGILTTAGCAVCFLVAFMCLHGTEQLLLVSLGGILALGGSAK